MFSCPLPSLFFILLLFQGGSVFSQTTSAETDKTPKYANEFLNIGVGARAQGMSLAQVASVSDVTSGYWNPAGLTSLKSDLQAAAMHSEYFAGIAKYDYAALAKKIDTISAVSFSVIRFGVDDIPNTIDLIDPGGNVNYDRITTFSAVDYAFILSYGRKGMPWKKAVAERGVAAISALPIEGFRWGINAKVLYRHIGDFAKAWGFGVDAGVQLGVKKWLFGAVAKDITSTFSAWSYSLDDRTREVFQQTGNEIPSNGLEVALPRVVLGAGRGFHLKKISILAEINSTFTTDGKRNTLVSSNPVSIDPGIGVEVGYNNVIFLRLGAGNIQRVKDFDESESLTFQPNLGIGLRIKRLYIDYALSDIGNVSDVLYSNVFSLQLDIYKSAKKL